MVKTFIQCTSKKTALLKQTKSLAAETCLPLLTNTNHAWHYLLEVTDKGLQLRENKKSSSPLSLSFTSERQKTMSMKAARQQLLARAAALSGKRKNTTVFDTTAGLGRDTWFFLRLGCQVTACERSVLLYTLLREAFSKISANLQDSLRLLSADAGEILEKLTSNCLPEVVYLDPMYKTRRKKSALPKKEMQLLRQLLGNDEDQEELFQLAMQKAQNRVVVKRLPEAKPIGAKPDFELKSKMVRYDVYLRNN